MSDYIVPPKGLVCHNGQVYGAGARVPGYQPAVKTEKPVEKPKPKPTTEGGN